MAIGHIKWFNQSKGFGFIVAENGRNILVSNSNLVSLEKGSSQLREGDAVRYKLRNSAIHGPEAIEVEPLVGGPDDLGEIR